jgi:hypothetical protein
MNGYALIAYATPVAAAALGWLAVWLHRRSLRHAHETASAKVSRSG